MEQEMRIGEEVKNKNLGGDKKKMKKKIAVLVGITLCTMLLISPALASNGDTLDIYGNANEDDTIDMRDLTYVKLIFFGKKPETELADAKYDGKINPLDFIQIKLIIVGKEKEITVIDSLGNIVTVNKPVNRIVATFSQVLELLRTFKLEKDRMVGAESVFYSGKTLANYKLFFPEWIDLPSVGTISNPDVEAILDLHPDVALLPASGWCAPMNDPAHNILKSAGISVLRVYGGVGTGAGAISIEETKKFGYIFDKEDESEEFIDWYGSIVNSIDEAVEKIPEEGKPKVYFESVMGGTKYHAVSDIYAHVDSAGGKNIFPKWGEVDPESVIERNPDIIIIMGKCGGYDSDADDTAEIEEMRGEMMNRPELKGVTAVKEGRVYVISNYIVCAYGEYNGCNCLLQIVYMTKWFHPELFEDLDPRAIQQEYLTRFQGLDIDLNEKGVFVYPRPS